MADLSTTSVFLDFDGTVATADTGVHLLARHAREGGQSIDADYVAGRIGSRECLVQEWALLPRDEDVLRATVRLVPVDPAFGPLLDGLRAAGAEVTVVSDGFGFY